MLRNTVLAAVMLAATAAPVLAAGSHEGGHYSFGEPGDPAKVTRTVQVELTDEMQILHDPLKIKQGETIRFVVVNRGEITHEFAIGDSPSQRAHALMMKKMPDMVHESDPATATLEPGETKELVWSFNKPIQGQIEFACHIAGHFEAGMSSKVALLK
ncbi:MAG: copper-containing oxidoreductase signal peptide protein [Alphaproteobacteria bacterium]|nr:MAG: copper-containing oxidoreductase signal peptide protein [Alphaproteobacteria bacterium]